MGATSRSAKPDQPASSPNAAALSPSSCAFAFAGSVSGNLQQVYGGAYTGTLILHQNVGCLAGCYDVDFGYVMDRGGYVDEGTVAGWFSVPVQ